MAEVSGIFPNMVGSAETPTAKTATEINTKTQGQMTRLSMIVDTINQDFIIPTIEKVAKLCADFKSGKEIVFVNHENKQEIIEIDDFIRQGEYKYTYSDTSSITMKSQQADILIQAVEKFAAHIPLNLQEIFVWYFEQKGVDTPERFLADNSAQNLQMSPIGYLSKSEVDTKNSEMLNKIDNIDLTSIFKNADKKSGLKKLLKDKGKKDLLTLFEQAVNGDKILGAKIGGKDRG